MTTLNELEALAKAATPYWDGPINAPVQEFIDAATPETILRLIELVKEMGEALEQFANVELSDDNCASYEVANKRIRNIANAALAKYKGVDGMSGLDSGYAGCQYSVGHAQALEAENKYLRQQLDTHKGIAAIAEEYGIDGFVEIEALRQRVKELNELLCTIHRDGGQYIQEHGQAKAYADAVEKLNEWKFLPEQLAAVTKERDEYKQDCKDMQEDYITFRKELAASQHYAQQLREALHVCAESIRHRFGKCHELSKADTALTLPCDTSELDALVKDAERYNTARAAFTNDGITLKNGDYLADILLEQGTPEKFDAAIDEAMK
jgi:hypothetical protein